MSGMWAARSFVVGTAVILRVFKPKTVNVVVVSVRGIKAAHIKVLVR